MPRLFINLFAPLSGCIATPEKDSNYSRSTYQDLILGFSASENELCMTGGTHHSANSNVHEHQHEEDGPEL